jgi:hypothetical protein
LTLSLIYDIAKAGRGEAYERELPLGPHPNNEEVNPNG